MKQYLAWALLLLSLVCWPSAYAEVELSNQIDLLQAQLEQLSDSESDKSRRQLLQQTITTLQSQRQLQSQIKQLKIEIDEQPATVKALSKILKKGFKTPPLPTLEKLGIEQLDRLITTLNTRLLELEREQALQHKQQTQAEQNQRRIRKQLTGLKLESELGTQPDSRLELIDNAELRKQQRDTSFEERGLRVQALELDLLALPRRSEIAKLTWQILENERQSNAEQLTVLREEKQEQQRSEAEKALSKLDEIEQNLEAFPLLANTSKENQLLSVQLRELLSRIESTDLRRTSLQQQLTILSTTFRSIAQQLELEVSHISPEQRRFIFRNQEPVDSAKTAKEINLLRLRNTLIEQQQVDLNQRYASLPLSVMAALPPSEQSIFRQSITTRRAGGMMKAPRGG